MQLINQYILEHTPMITVDRYLTTIIGEITIYGIIMTFYQFVSSYQKEEKVYLGYNLKNYIIDKDSPLQKIMNRRGFKNVCLGGILFIPVICFLRDFISMYTYVYLVLVWYLWIVCFFLISFLATMQAAKSVRFLRRNLDIERNEYWLNRIDKEYEKKFIKDGITLEKLEKELEFIKKAIDYDKSPEFQNRYENLVLMLFMDYLYAMNSSNYTNIQTKNEIEMRIIYNFLLKRYIDFNRECLTQILSFQLKMIEYNIQNVFNKSEDVKKEILFCNNYSTELDWYKISELIYQLEESGERKKYIEFMREIVLFKNVSEELKKFCEQNIFLCLSLEIRELCIGERNEQDIYNIFAECIEISGFKKNLCYNIYILLEGWEATLPDKLLELLDEVEKVIIFIYIIGYITIYKMHYSQVSRHVF